MMNKIIKTITPVVFGMIMAGCEKTSIPEFSEDSGKYQVTLTTNLNYKEMQTRSAIGVQESGVSRISYAIFDISGNRVKTTTTQTKDGDSDSDFGYINTRLDQGTYILVTVAYSGSGNCTISSAEKVTFKNSLVSDTYSSVDTLKVTSDMSEFLTLDRVVSKIIIDGSGCTRPGNLDKVKFYYTGGSSTLNPKTGYGCVKSKQSVTMDLTDSEVYEVYTFPYQSNTSDISMSVYLLDSDGNDFDEITITPDFKVTKNKVTSVKISFYDRHTWDTGIQVDPVWASDTLKYVY